MQKLVSKIQMCSPQPVTAVLLAGVFCLSGCFTEQLEVNEVPLTASSFWESVDQNLFMEHVWTMQKVEDILYLSGEGYPHILALDGDLGVVRRIGKKGKGPGEFSIWPANFYATRDRIYGYDSGSRRIHIFLSTGEHSHSFALDPKHKILSQGLSVDTQGHVYVATMFPQDPYSITKLDSLGTNLKNFGDILATSYSEVLNRRLSARRVILVNDDYLLTVGQSVPIIEKFSLNGELIQSSDLSGIPYFSGRLRDIKDYYSSDPKGQVATKTIVGGIAATSTRLYIMPIEAYPDDRIRVNRLLELDLESLDPLSTYNMLDHLGEPLRWIQSFEFLSENELILFHYTDGVFYRYVLPE